MITEIKSQFKRLLSIELAKIIIPNLLDSKSYLPIVSDILIDESSLNILDDKQIGKLLKDRIVDMCFNCNDKYTISSKKETLLKIMNSSYKYPM